MRITFTAGARAQKENSWRFNLASLDLWIISIDGDLGVRARTASASIEISDVLNNLQGVFTVHFNRFYKNRIDLRKSRLGAVRMATPK